MTNETELNTRIRHLEDENERLNRALNSEVTKLAREIYLTALPVIGEGIKFTAFFDQAKAFYDEALHHERGLGKQSEMENGNG